MSFKALICTVYHAVTIATLIYLCTSCLCQDVSNTDGNLHPECELWHFHTFNDLDKEASPLHCGVGGWVIFS